MAAPRKVPMRMCIGCRERFPKKELIRVVRRASDNEVMVDPTGKISGRGVYVCRANPSCLERAVKSRGLERQLEQAIAPEVYESLRRQMEAYAGNEQPEA